ncbi:MAG: hypothetical protein QF410_13725 [Planctomycetota bacterium]|nr:hypothetical protein [Deltaproteobacteria bacterium]MDP6540596.1 hypothetical protein [Planctomycetota bacterium]
MLKTRLLLLPCLLLLALGCVQTVKGQAHPALRERTEPIRKVAVAPFAVAERLIGSARPGALDPAVGAELLGAQFAERLRDRGVEVIPPSDVARALVAAGVSGRLIPRQVAALVAQEFGADAVLMGELRRLVEREGSAAGAMRGATIGFQADLRGAPGGARLWTGNVDETQRPLSENVLDASRYPGGGSRWLTAEELLVWGAEQTTLSIPLY